MSSEFPSRVRRRPGRPVDGRQAYCPARPGQSETDLGIVSQALGNPAGFMSVWRRREAPGIPHMIGSCFFISLDLLLILSVDNATLLITPHFLYELKEPFSDLNIIYYEFNPLLTFLKFPSPPGFNKCGVGRVVL